AQATIDLPAGTGPHITTFSPDGKYAYVSGMGNGDLDVIQTGTRRLLKTLSLGPTATHQAKPSPNGSTLLMAQVAQKSLIKVSVDEVAQTWQPGSELSFGAIGKAPICTIFSDDGQRAFVSLNPNGLAIVDVATMRLQNVLATDGSSRVEWSSPMTGGPSPWQPVVVEVICIAWTPRLTSCRTWGYWARWIGTASTWSQPGLSASAQCLAAMNGESSTRQGAVPLLWP